MKISKEDLDLIGDNKIILDVSTGYYRILFKGKGYKYVHRYILGAKKGDIVDHIDMDRTNNLRSNLRLVTKKLNNYNRKILNPLGRGVYFDKYGNRFRACISHNNKTLKLGSFKNAKDAKKAYNKKALEIYGSNAYQHNI